MPGKLFNRFVNDLEQHEAFRIVTIARGVMLPNMGAEGWSAMLDRAQERPEANETFFRYEGRPVRVPELIGALGKRWGTGFSAETN